jgi:hypothetical protein
MTRTFKAVTWNIFVGTAVAELDPIMKRQLKLGVSVLGMQEAGGKDIDDLCKRNGLRTFLYRPSSEQTNQWRIAWDPEVWVKVDVGGEQMSETHWFQKQHTVPIYSYMATAILCDKRGKSLYFGSYHWPAHIQPTDRKPARYDAAVETAKKMGKLAAASECAATLFVGDSNWDTDTGPQTADTIPYFKGLQTGLREIKAPAATHGKRQIDNMYTIRGGAIRHVKDGAWVAPGGGDHKVHGREFEWL